MQTIHYYTSYCNFCKENTSFVTYDDTTDGNCSICGFEMSEVSFPVCMCDVVDVEDMVNNAKVIKGLPIGENE